MLEIGVRYQMDRELTELLSNAIDQFVLCPSFQSDF